MIEWWLIDVCDVCDVIDVCLSGFYGVRKLRTSSEEKLLTITFQLEIEDKLQL